AAGTKVATVIVQVSEHEADGSPWTGYRSVGHKLRPRHSKNAQPRLALFSRQPLAMAAEPDDNRTSSQEPHAHPGKTHTSPEHQRRDRSGLVSRRWRSGLVSSFRTGLIITCC